MQPSHQRGRRLRQLGTVLLAITCLGGLTGILLYPGMAQGGFWLLWDGDLAGTVNVTHGMLYWAQNIGGMERGDGGNRWDFSAPLANTTAPETRARFAFNEGFFGQAIQDLETTIAEHGANRDRLFWLALTYQRQSEAENCLADLQANHSGDHPASSHAPRVCSLPFERTYSKAEASHRASTLYAQLLEEHRGDRELVRWLLDLTHLTRGESPAEIPTQSLHEGPMMEVFYGPTSEAIAEDHEHLQFVDQAPVWGVDVYDAGKGVAVEDFDGDGDLDLVTGGSFDPLRYFEHNGNRFVDRTADAGFDGLIQSHIITHADVDNDGWLDLFVGSLLQPDRLLRNLGGGTFTDITRDAGLATDPNRLTMSWASAWDDIDLDGDLDLFVARWGIGAPFVSGVLARDRLDSGLYRNDDGQFVDITDAWGLAEVVDDGAFIGATFGDIDGDGDGDLLLSSPIARRGVLLLNTGNRFEVIQHFGVGFLAAFLDVDHDGQLEIFQAGISDARTAIQKAVYGQTVGTPEAGRSRLLRRGDNGRFEVVEGFLGHELPIGTMGSNYGDLDNDGCFDFYLGTGDPEPWFILPNLMYSGQRSGRTCELRAENISGLNGFGNLQKGHGIVFFDVDNDGDQDLYSSLGGMWPGDRWPNQLFVNHSNLTDQDDNNRHWIKIRLRGRQTNRFGVGATIRVKATAADGESFRRTYRMDLKTAFGSAPYLAHIGLLDAVAIDHIDVHWPVSRCTARYPGELDTLVELDEALCAPSSQH